MTTQHAVKDSWSGRQVWWCPSKLTVKLLQWQSLAAKQDTGKSQLWSSNQKVQWNMALSNTDQVKDLHIRGDVGVPTQPAPLKIAVPKQTFSTKATPE